ncbi:MAG: hypothetical protein EBT61_20100 [Verrucomicrobia bacterium]|nr:hypothetical protein [Verrucomicrobiota bacterium]
MKTLLSRMNDGNYSRLAVRLCFLIIAAVTFTSCTCLNVKKVEGDFDGLKAALNRTQSKGTLRLLLVHGMTDHQAGWSSNLVSGLTTRLHLVLDPASGSKTTYKRQTQSMGTVQVSQFTNSLATSKLRVYELTWSDVTRPWKTNQFTNDESHAHQSERVWVNRRLKTSLMNDGFGDAVLYAGHFRENMQYPIMRAVAQMLDDGLNPDDEVAIVTTSLGSYMTLDTLARMSQGFPILNEATVQTDEVHRLIQQTTQLFMLANQIPLLELSDVSNRLDVATSPKSASMKASHGLKGFLSERQKVLQAVSSPNFDTARWKLRVVAISDPNDILSYPLAAKDVANSNPLDVSVLNVLISVERYAILGVFAWPKTAHAGHDKSSGVLDLMVNGHP